MHPKNSQHALSRYLFKNLVPKDATLWKYANQSTYVILVSCVGTCSYTKAANILIICLQVLPLTCGIH